jgi:glucose/arabinose dehydrogenase
MIDRVHGLAFAALVVVLSVAGCGDSTAPPTPSPPGSGGGGESISGRERIGWDQQASNAVELATFRYAIYVDGARSELAETSCSDSATAAGFGCSGRLPPLSPGAHTLELAAYVDQEGVLESARSSPLRVTVVASAAPGPVAQWDSGHVENTADGVGLRMEKLIGGLEEPVDAAFAPDGRLFIAERVGRVRVVNPGQPQPEEALTLDADENGERDHVLSIAVDPDFARTHFVFVMQHARTARSASGPVFRLARYRDLRGTLAERAILLETDGTAGALAAAVVRFGRDGKLYLALGDQGGRLLRLNVDGTMPRDQAGTAPAIAHGIRSPRGMDWDPRSSLLWIADDDGSSGHLSALATSSPPVRALVRGRHALAETGGSVAFYRSDVVPALRGDAFVASSSGRHLLRLRFADGDPARISNAEPLLQDRVGAIRVVAIGSDGALYFCTDDSLGRLVPER